MLLESEDQSISWVRGTFGEVAFQALESFVALLREEVARQNLISAATWGAIWQRHIADSAQLVPIVPRETSSWVDLGTGAGFPGIVAAILRPDIHFTLVENRRLRIDWLRRVIGELGLKNCTVFAGSAHAMPIEPADIISARAFAPLDAILAIAGRFSTEQTMWLLPKGRGAGQELRLLPPSLQEKFTMVPSITDRDANILIGRRKMVAGQ